MTGQLELWQPGWDIEPCDTAAAPVPAARRGNPYANAADNDERGRPLTSDHARPPGRGDAWRLLKPVIDVTIQGEML
ncbi:hypothetical protein J7E97_07990 [Streptomyces sp. ISL-66]|uniref:hypothetical protein n=1 Tax=Streptomyces sp. ISL-66 TaxID=2819186 RepID=UPI001BE4E31E|nr:hypothetical protein [Streptomyces sp. ISL-66]MBT2467813.1 hypothetical protein [Streptomyces sp. ISL-66]